MVIDGFIDVFFFFFIDVDGFNRCFFFLFLNTVVSDGFDSVLMV